jgi:hypothetical protein
MSMLHEAAINRHTVSVLAAVLSLPCGVGLCNALRLSSSSSFHPGLAQSTQPAALLRKGVLCFMFFFWRGAVRTTLEANVHAEQFDGGFRFCAQYALSVHGIDHNCS